MTNKRFFNKTKVLIILLGLVLAIATISALSNQSIRQAYADYQGQYYQTIRKYSSGGFTGEYQIPISEEQIIEYQNFQNNNFQPLTTNPFETSRIMYSGRHHRDSIVVVLMGDGFGAEEYGVWCEVEKNPGTGTVLYHAYAMMNTMLATHPFSIFKHLFTVYVIHSHGTHPRFFGHSYLGSVRSNGTFSWTHAFLSDSRIAGLANTLVDSPYYIDMVQVISNSTCVFGVAFIEPRPIVDGNLFPVRIAVSSIVREGNCYHYGLCDCFKPYNSPAGGTCLCPNPDCSVFSEGTMWHNTMIHEFGHTFGGLVDERGAGARIAENSTQVPNDNNVPWRHWFGHRKVDEVPFREFTNGWVFPSPLVDGCLMRGITRDPEIYETYGERILMCVTKEFCGVCSAVLIARMAWSSGEVFYAGSGRPADVTISQGATRILDSAFNGNTNLHSLIIPSSVTEIGDFAFLGATSLRYIHNHSMIPQQINLTTFANSGRQSNGEPNQLQQDIIVYIPAGTRQAYLDAGWTGVILNESTSIILPPYLTSLSQNTFYGLHNLQSITLPSTIPSIHPTYFHGLNELQSLLIPTGVNVANTAWWSDFEKLTFFVENPVAFGWKLQSGRPVLFGVELSECRTFVAAFNRGNNIRNHNAVNGISAPFRKGYTFGGWSLTPVEAGDRYARVAFSAENVYRASSNARLYAIWLDNRFIGNYFTLTFNAQGGNIDGNANNVSRSIRYGQRFDLPIPTRRHAVYTNLYYEFNGWWTTPNVAGTRIDNSSLISLIASNNITVYARWLLPRMTVSFNSQYGTSLNGRVFRLGQTYGVLPAVSRAGHRFDGWWTHTEGGQRILPNDYVFAGDHTLHARWECIDFIAVTFISNNQQEPTVWKHVTHGLNYGFTQYNTHTNLPIPTRDGYVFMGWWTCLDDGVIVHTDTIVANANDHNLYAKWLRLHTVSFFIEASDDTTLYTKLIEHGSFITRPATNPTRADYRFLHWACADNIANNTDQPYKQFDWDTPVNRDINLIAIWVRTLEWIWSVADDFAGGNGTATNPYLIGTASQLARVAFLTNLGQIQPNTYFELRADIYLNDTEFYYFWDCSTAGLNQWTPIGTEDNPFRGNFYGNGFSVRGIFITGGLSNIGLFGVVDGGTINNATVEQSFIIGFINVGGIVGQLIGGGIIENSVNHGTVRNISGIAVGGIVGFVGDSYVLNNSNYGDVKSYTRMFAEIGGIVGVVYGYSVIEGNSNFGIVEGDMFNSFVGGIVGLVRSENVVLSGNWFLSGYGINEGLDHVGGLDFGCDDWWCCDYWEYGCDCDDWWYPCCDYWEHGCDCWNWIYDCYYDDCNCDNWWYCWCGEYECVCHNWWTPCCDDWKYGCECGDIVVIGYCCCEDGICGEYCICECFIDCFCYGDWDNCWWCYDECWC